MGGEGLDTRLVESDGDGDCFFKMGVEKVNLLNKIEVGRNIKKGSGQRDCAVIK